MREISIDEKEVKRRIKEHRDEQEEKSREKIKDYFLTGQMNPEVTKFALHLLGVSAKKAKELTNQWTSKK